LRAVAATFSAESKLGELRDTPAAKAVLLEPAPEAANAGPILGVSPNGG
jgi:hypothetical protein